MVSSSVSWRPSISYRSTYNLTTLILVFLLLFFHLVPPELLCVSVIKHSCQLTSPLYFSCSCCCYSIRNLQSIIISHSPAILIFYWAVYLSKYFPLAYFKGWFNLLTFADRLPKFNPPNTELNPICHLLELLGAHHILHVTRIRVKQRWTLSVLGWVTDEGYHVLLAPLG